MEKRLDLQCKKRLQRDMVWCNRNRFFLINEFLTEVLNLIQESCTIIYFPKRQNVTFEIQHLIDISLQYA